MDLRLFEKNSGVAALIILTVLLFSDKICALRSSKSNAELGCWSPLELYWVIYPVLDGLYYGQTSSFAGLRAINYASCEFALLLAVA